MEGFWQTHKLGKIKFTQKESDIEVVTEKCFFCDDLPEVGRTLCDLDEVMLESAINTKLGLEYSVTEEECSGLGNGHCKSVIRFPKG